MNTALWTDLTKLSLPPGNFIIRAVVVYLAVLLLLRLSGKREVGQMSAPEFITIMLISNAVQNSMNGGDNSLVGGLILATVLVVLTSLIGALVYRSKRARALIEGTPTLLVHRGKVLSKNLARERLRVSELKTLLRKQGVHSYQDVQTAVLEADGTLSVLRTGEKELSDKDLILTEHVD